MTPYGLRRHPKFHVFRLKYPAGFQYEIPIVQGVYIYPLTNSGVVQYDAGTSNTSLVGTSTIPGTLIATKDIMYGTYVKFTILNADAESVHIVPIEEVDSPQIDNFASGQIVEVDGSYTLPAQTYCVVVEGTLSFNLSGSSFTANSEEDTYIFDSKMLDTEVTGQGRLLTFNIVENA